MTKPEPMGVGEAVDFLREWSAADSTLHIHCDNQCGQKPMFDKLRAALAALEGIHIYGSRFKENDPVSYLMHTQQGWEVHGPIRWSTDFLCIERDCFPTLEAAEAECQRRNEKGVE